MHQPKLRSFFLLIFLFGVLAATTGSAHGQLSGRVEAGSSRYDGQRYFNLGSKNPNEPWIAPAEGTSGVGQDDSGNFWLGTNGMLRWDDTRAS